MYAPQTGAQRSCGAEAPHVPAITPPEAHGTTLCRNADLHSTARPHTHLRDEHRRGELCNRSAAGLDSEELGHGGHNNELCMSLQARPRPDASVRQATANGEVWGTDIDIDRANGRAAGCEVMIVDARQCRICPIFASTKSHSELSPDHQGNLPNALPARPESSASAHARLACQPVRVAVDACVCDIITHECIACTRRGVPLCASRAP